MKEPTLFFILEKNVDLLSEYAYTICGLKNKLTCYLECFDMLKNKAFTKFINTKSAF